MTKQILFVDDDPQILHSYKLALEKQYKIMTAESGELALDLLAENSFAVIVSDMRMPGMDGAQFLSEARKIAPDTVRIMLTGYAEVETAIQAVNSGQIFRFLTKPCPIKDLVPTLEEAIRQYRLVTDEQELLVETLNGSIKIMTEVLGMVNPVAFGRSQRLRKIVLHMAESLELPDKWRYGIAAMLSQIGCVSLPEETLKSMYSGDELSAEELEQLSNHPDLGRELISNIPRLDSIGQMVNNQLSDWSSFKDSRPVAELTPTIVGSQMLRIAVDFDRYITGGMIPSAALGRLKKHVGRYNPELLETLHKAADLAPEKTIEQIQVADLRPGMIIDQDVVANNGALLFPKGTEINLSIIHRLRMFSEGGIGLAESIRVVVGG
jgi:response regulator RpfG family c-di-GMP phosphodiesterase